MKTSDLYRIEQAELNAWLDDLSREAELIAPREAEGLTLYRPVSSSAEIAWGGERPLLSLKEFFFPPTERLLLIEKFGREVKLTETLPEERRVIFGARSCDARGLQTLDALFIRHQPSDPYYARRRENAVIIGLACRETGASCFCDSVGGAPDDPSGMDLQLTETGHGYALRVLTPKGQALVERLALPPFEGELPAPPRNQPADIPPAEVWRAHFSDDYWKKLSQRCLSCRVCAYACPTCRCFAARDEALSANGDFERIRCWDSCTGANYRRIAGGHVARASKEERLRNRFLCKFDYYAKQYDTGGQPACSGCGRCVDLCPAGIDVVEVAANLGRLA